MVIDVVFKEVKIKIYLCDRILCQIIVEMFTVNIMKLSIQHSLSLILYLNVPILFT